MKRRFSAAILSGVAASVMAVAPANAQGLDIPQLPPELTQAIPQPNFPDIPSIDIAKELEKVPGQAPLQLPEPRVHQGDLPNQDVAENYVSFGDSVAANPSQLDIVATRLGRAAPGYSWPTIRDNRCAQGIGNFPSRAAVKTGLRLVDYSCGGATAWTPSAPQDPIPHNTLNEQVDSAMNEGQLNENTRLATISIGVNDFWQPGNGPELGQDARNARYDQAVGGAIDRIHEAAPNARVIMLGLPDQTDGANNTCPTNIWGGVSHWYFPFVSYYQDELRNAQMRVSGQHGADYLDMVSEINLGKNNNGCSTDQNRLSASIWDDAPHRFPFHLTDAGNEYYANRINDVYHS